MWGVEVGPIFFEVDQGISDNAEGAGDLLSLLHFRFELDAHEHGYRVFEILG